MTLGYFESHIGIGPTDELSLRVSVAALVRVILETPQSHDLMLALERKATLTEQAGSRFANVKAQPFGGALQIYDARRLWDVIGDFRFDSQESRSQQDFRLFIRPAAWEAVREFCLEQFSMINGHVLEPDPRRELAEEFADTLQIQLKPDQYTYQPSWTILEDPLGSRGNGPARRVPTVRIYRIFEAHILDSSLALALLRNSQRHSDADLASLAQEDVQNGGPGWANAALVLPLKQLARHYAGISPEARNQPTSFQNHQLDETVACILEKVPVPKYQRL
jgi:hypothetical protein